MKVETNSSAIGQAQPRAGDDVRPLAPLPPKGVPLVAIVAGFLVLAAGLFFLLEGRRHEKPTHSSRDFSQAETLASAPALIVPPPPPRVLPVQLPPPPTPAPQIQYVDRPGPAPPPVIQYVDRPAAQRPPVEVMVPGKPGDPALVVDLGDATAATMPTGAESAARATVLRNRASLVPEGTLIAAVLETPINSTRPGPVRAITSADTKGFDGARILIPRGSRLVGEFHADVQAGQNRVLVTWNRLVRPDGVAIRLVSPATDALGGTGIAGAVNNHLVARVGSVVMQTALTIGTELAAAPGPGSVVIGGPGQAVSSAAQPLISGADLKPTISVKEGAAITVFVVRDLDFGGAAYRQ